MPDVSDLVGGVLRRRNRTSSGDVDYVSLVDAQGNAQLAQNPPLVLSQPPGGTRRTLGSVFVRRRVQPFQLGTSTATGLSTSAAAPTFYNSVHVGDFTELLVWAVCVSSTGSCTSPVLVAQFWDYWSTPQLWVPFPNSPYSLPNPSGASVALGSVQLTNFGDIVRFGLYASANSYTGGTLAVYLKAKS